jgi:hypothetical protein
VIALLATIVGALISTGAQLWIAALQAKRDEADKGKQLVTAARMMTVDLSRARSNIEYSVNYREWWRTAGLSPRLSPEDRRLVIGALTPRGFYNVDRAEGSIDHWYSIREYELGRNRIVDKPQFPQSYRSDSIEIQIDKLQEIITWIAEAIVSLREITGDPQSVDEPDEPTEATALIQSRAKQVEQQD